MTSDASVRRREAGYMDARLHRDGPEVGGRGSGRANARGNEKKTGARSVR